jgi:hypothetical protein
MEAPKRMKEESTMKSSATKERREKVNGLTECYLMLTRFHSARSLGISYSNLSKVQGLQFLPRKCSDFVPCECLIVSI